MIYIIDVKFGVARFDYSRQFSGALSSEASDEWASRFYLYAFWINYLLKTSMRSPIEPKTF